MNVVLVYPANICLFKVNNRNTSKGCENMFKVNNKISYDVVLVFLLLTLTYVTPFSSVSVVDFEQVNVSWVFLITLSQDFPLVDTPGDVFVTLKKFLIHKFELYSEQAGAFQKCGPRLRNDNCLRMKIIIIVFTNCSSFLLIFRIFVTIAQILRLLLLQNQLSINIGTYFYMFCSIIAINSFMAEVPIIQKPGMKELRITLLVFFRFYYRKKRYLKSISYLKLATV